MVTIRKKTCKYKCLIRLEPLSSAQLLLCSISVSKAHFKSTSVDNIWGRKKESSTSAFLQRSRRAEKPSAAQHFGTQWTFLRWMLKYGTVASLFTAVFQSNRLDTAALWFASCVQRHYGGSPEQMDCIFRCHHVVKEKRYEKKGKMSLSHSLFLSI